MAIEKLDFKIINEVVRNEQIKKLADKVNEVIDEVSPVTEHVTFDSQNNRLVVDRDVNFDGQDIMVENINVFGNINLIDNDDQSVKKIYCHPITLYNSYSKNRCQFLLFDNRKTAWTYATIDNLYDYLVSFTSARFLTVGIYTDETYTNELLFQIASDGTTLNFIIQSSTATVGTMGIPVSKVQFRNLYTGLIDTVHAIN